MKSIKIIGILIVTLSLLFGCNDSFMDRIPLDELTSETFWESENDLAAYTANYYTYIPNYSKVLWDDEVSDNMAPAKYNTKAAGLHLASTGTWDWSFLRTCNYFLANYEKATLTEDKKNEYAAETRFFRAWLYYDRVVQYGDVPYVDKVLTTGDTDILMAKRSPRNEVMDKVIEDLTYAVAHLPESREDGRVNKFVALHLKARVCLFEGTYRKYHHLGEATSYLRQAIESAETLMNSGKFEVYNTGNPTKDYEAIYIQNDLKNNKEMIFYRQYISDILGHGGGIPIRLIEGNNNGFTKDLINDYLCIDGKPISLSELYKGDKTLDDEFENRDPRLLQTIVPPGTGYFKGSSLVTEVVPRLFVAKGNGSLTSTGYHWRKAYTNEAVLLYDKAETDLPIFRYAETLLIYAEAKAELGEATQADIDKSINLLRNRVAMPPMIIGALQRDPDSDMTLAAGYLEEEVPVLIEEIRRERRVELAAEGFRYYDLLRWRAGKFFEKQVLGARWSYFLGLKEADGSSIYDNASVGKDIFINEEGYIEPYQRTIPDGRRVFDSNKHYLEAIPLGELSLNPNLGQNPGW